VEQQGHEMQWVEVAAISLWHVPSSPHACERHAMLVGLGSGVPLQVAAEALLLVGVREPWDAIPGRMNHLPRAWTSCS